MSAVDRETLKFAFETGKTPSQDDFGNLIDSMLNREDDKVYRPGVSDPLSIKAVGGEESLLNFYREETLTWQLKQKPASSMSTIVEHAGDNVLIDNDTPTDGLSIHDANTNEAPSRLFIQGGSGNVGIGTVFPKADLDVKGAFKIQTAGTRAADVNPSPPSISSESSSGEAPPPAPTLLTPVNQSHRLYFDQHNLPGDGISLVYCGIENPTIGGTRFQLPANALHIVRHNGSESGTAALSVLQSSGNVGIGTTKPSVALEVNGTVKAATFDGTLDAAKITTGTLPADRIPNFPASKITTGTVAGALTILESGNVGIGTTAATAKLTVAGGARGVGVVLEKLDDNLHSLGPHDIHVYGYDGSPRIDVGDWVVNRGERKRVIRVRQGIFEVQGHGFPRRNGGFFVERPKPIFQAKDDRGDSQFLISSQGKVGIGTTDPKSILHVHGLVMQTHAVDEAMKDTFAQAPANSMMFAVNDFGSLSFWWKDSKGRSHFGEITEKPTA